MEGAREILNRHQAGERSLLGGFDFAGILAQFGRDLRQPECLEELGLGPASDLAALAGKGVFVEAQPPRQRPFADGDVVGLRAGEVVQSERELAILHAPQIALDKLVGFERRQEHAGLGGAVGQHLGHLGQCHEVFQDRSRVLRAEEDVQVADRLGPPSQAAADLRANDLGVLADRLENRRDQEQCFVEQNPPAGLLQKSDPLQDVGLGLAAKALQLGDRPRLGGRAEVGQAFDLERLAEGLDLLGAEAGHLEQRQDAGRHRLAQFIVRRQLTGRGELDDLGVHGLADSRHVGQGAVGDHLGQIGRQVREHLCRVVIGPAAKRVLALDLQDGSHLVKNLGDACGFHERPRVRLPTGLWRCTRDVTLRCCGFARGALPSTCRITAPRHRARANARSARRFSRVEPASGSGDCGLRLSEGRAREVPWAHSAAGAVVLRRLRTQIRAEVMPMPMSAMEAGSGTASATKPWNTPLASE